MQAPPQERLQLQSPWGGSPAAPPLCLPAPSITRLCRSTGHNPVRETSVVSTETPHCVLFNARPYFANPFVVPFSALQDLQGAVESFFLTVASDHLSQILVFPPEINSSVISDLWPSTMYVVSLQVSNGAHNTTKATVNVTTEDGGTRVIALWGGGGVREGGSCTVRRFNTSKRVC